MLKIINNNISLTKGDSAYITITPKDIDGSDYKLVEGDHVRIEVRDAKYGGSLLFEGDITESEEGLMWYICPENTENTIPGTTYYWDAQLEKSNGDVYTFIPVKKLKILDEITLNSSTSGGTSGGNTGTNPEEGVIDSADIARIELLISEEVSRAKNAEQTIRNMINILRTDIEERMDEIEMKVTVEDEMFLEAVIESGLAEPAYATDGSIYISESGEIYIL